VLASGQIQVTPEEPINTRDKGTRLLRTIKVPVKDKAGKAEYLLGYSEDITERKATEQQLRQAVKMEAVGQLTGGCRARFQQPARHHHRQPRHRRWSRPMPGSARSSWKR
jgi:hypothetical protein